MTSSQSLRCWGWRYSITWYNGITYVEPSIYVSICIYISIEPMYTWSSVPTRSWSHRCYRCGVPPCGVGCCYCALLQVPWGSVGYYCDGVLPTGGDDDVDDDPPPTIGGTVVTGHGTIYSSPSRVLPSGSGGSKLVCFTSGRSHRRLDRRQSGVNMPLVAFRSLSRKERQLKIRFEGPSMPTPWAPTAAVAWTRSRMPWSPPMAWSTTIVWSH